MATTGYSFTELARLADIDFKRIGTPLGTILPFYGTAAPAGFLELNGQKVLKDAYPDLYDHLIKMSRGDKGASRALTSADNGKIVTPVGSTTTVGRVYVGESLQVGIQWIYGSAPQTGTFDIYAKMGDIPLNNAIYLEDARSMYMSGFDSRTARGVMESQGDATRNMEGSFEGNNEPIFMDETMILKGVFSAGAMTTANQPRIDQPSHNQVRKVDFNASGSVPTDSTIHPNNLNPLWMIKAYDVISDPEALAAKVITDQVNQNTANIQEAIRLSSVVHSQVTINGATWTESLFGNGMVEYSSPTTFSVSSSGTTMVLPRRIKFLGASFIDQQGVIGGSIVQYGIKEQLASGQEVDRITLFCKGASGSSTLVNIKGYL